MSIKSSTRLFAIALFSVGAVPAQDQPLNPGSVSIKFPGDSPVAQLEFSTGDSRVSARGAALMLDLHLVLKLQNTSGNRIHGLTLRVVSQEVTLGGTSSVSLFGLNVGPREPFPVHIDMRLMRPSQMASGGLVDVSLDGVLFQDLSFWGPDRLNSRRTLTAWEMQAQRDRAYLKKVLARSGPEGLRRAIFNIEAARPLLDVAVLRGPAVTSAALAPERVEQFAMVEFPDSPVQPVGGWARVAGNEARAPRIEVRNRSNQPVKFVELGWLLRDPSGQQYLAASVPATDSLYLPAGKKASVEQDTALRVTRNGQQVNIKGASAFVSKVQFADGRLWVPSREDLERTALVEILPPSAEEQRLSSLYVSKGLNALVDELKKF
ncbi:MAG TPA: hypothetical protein VKB88_07335 [Bryobacteraceae bacterium]|nr:hypothetical protein [Bryobacteraceae bacterium]